MECHLRREEGGIFWASAKGFIYIKLFHHSALLWGGYHVTPFYRWGNYGSERLGKFSEVTQIACEWARVRPEVCVSAKPVLSPSYLCQRPTELQGTQRRARAMHSGLPAWTMPDWWVWIVSPTQLQEMKCLIRWETSIAQPLPKHSFNWILTSQTQ